MQQKIKFITATEEHCKKLAFLNKCLIDEGGSYNTMSIQQLENRMMEFISSNNYIVIIFDVDNTQIGYTLVNKIQTPVFIRHFFIMKEFRRKGYGSSAFNKLVDYLKVDKIDLSVLSRNEIGYEFWTSCGFAPYETFMHYRKI